MTSTAVNEYNFQDPSSSNDNSTYFMTLILNFQQSPMTPTKKKSQMPPPSGTLIFTEPTNLPASNNLYPFLDCPIESQIVKVQNP